jgi:peroxiredoxin
MMQWLFLNISSSKALFLLEQRYFAFFNPNQSRQVIKALLVGLLWVSLAACSAGQEELERLSETRAAPDFTIEDMQGNTHSLADYRGKVLVVNFWATWCPPCVKEMPSLQRAREKLRNEDIAVLAINMGEQQQAIEDFIQKYPVDLPILLDKDVNVADAWSVKGLPTTYVVNPDGEIVYQVIGEREWDDPDLLEEIRGLQ